jgi:hypothetical protein
VTRRELDALTFSRVHSWRMRREALRRPLTWWERAALVLLILGLAMTTCALVGHDVSRGDHHDESAWPVPR